MFEAGLQGAIYGVGQPDAPNQSLATDANGQASFMASMQQQNPVGVAFDAAMNASYAAENPSLDMPQITAANIGGPTNADTQQLLDSIPSVSLPANDNTSIPTLASQTSDSNLVEADQVQKVVVTGTRDTSGNVPGTYTDGYGNYWPVNGGFVNTSNRNVQSKPNFSVALHDPNVLSDQKKLQQIYGQYVGYL